MIAGHGGREHEAMLGDEAAKRSSSAPATPCTSASGRSAIAGIYHSGDRFVDLGANCRSKVVQALAQRPHEMTTIGVTVKPGETPKAVAKRLERKFPGIVAVVEPGQAVRSTRRAG